MIKIKSSDSRNRVNFTWITDLHLSAVPVGRRGDNYMEALFAKLEFVRALTEKIKGVCLVGGDVFHYKPPKHLGNALMMIERLIRVFGSYPTGMVWGAIGNHDLSFDRHDSLPNQPLGILIAAGVYHNLVESPVIFTNNDDSVCVSVETFPYLAEGKALQAILGAGPRLPNITHRIGVVHAYGHPGDAGDLYGEPIIGYNELKGVDFDYLLWGHDHSRAGVHEVGKTTHIRLGSLARAAFSWDEVDRPVSSAILSFAADGVRYKEVEVPVNPLQIAFQTADKGMETVANSAAMKEFFTGMDEAVSTMEIADSQEVIKELCGEDHKLKNFIFELCDMS